MLSFRGSCRTLKYAFVCFLIAATAFNALGQVPAGRDTRFTEIAPAARDEANKGVDAFRRPLRISGGRWNSIRTIF